MQTVKAISAKPEITVYHDGGCRLCRAEIGHYRRSQGAECIAFIDVGRGVPLPDLGPDLDRDAALHRFHVRTADGRLVSGAAAFAQLWRTLPGWRWLGRLVDLQVFGWRPFLPLAEGAYRLSLPIRPRLARLLRRTHRF